MKIQSMLEKLLQTINQKVKLSKEDIDLIQNYFEPISFAKNTIIEEQNKIGDYLYFINSGFIRLFYDDENGIENTNQISTSNEFVVSYLDFIQGNPAKENIESITESELIRIKKADLRILIDQSENFKNFSVTIFEKAMTATSNRANDLATLSAEQRYKKLIQNQPEILQNIPIQYIASFLGMKPESLSRIRKNIIS